MPWNAETLKTVKAGLLESAQNGQFIPFHWVAGVLSDDDGGQCMYGCGWGLVGWFAAVAMVNEDWAKDQMPVGATQLHVNQILIYAGLTPAEIESMDPEATWESFDNALWDAYDNREDDYQTYIDKSIQLAQFFINVISAVPVKSATVTAMLQAKAQPGTLHLSPDDLAEDYLPVAA